MSEDEQKHLLRIDPREWKKPKGYANGVLVPAGRDLLFVAGQIGWDAEEKVVGLSEVNLTARLALQFEKALENICSVLEEAGTDPSQICRMTVYVTDKQRYLGCLKEIGAAWKRLIG
ncbi:MAG: RidA family protein, partial [Planctomycetota bacterium]